MRIFLPALFIGALFGCTPLPEAPTGPDCTALRCVALTFDGGPNGNSEPVLDILAAYQAHATFFLIGKNVGKAPEIVARMASAGHELGNHSWSHTPLPRLSEAQIIAEIESTNAAIAAASGGITPLVFRPPYGSYSPRVAAILPYAPILWNLDTNDWDAQSSAEIVRAAARARPGMIILMHSFVGHTVRALPRILQTLTDKGFTFVTVSELQARQP